jgi:hypothetical protein
LDRSEKKLVIASFKIKKDLKYGHQIDDIPPPTLRPGDNIMKHFFLHPQLNKLERLPLQASQNFAYKN